MPTIAELERTVAQNAEERKKRVAAVHKLIDQVDGWTPLPQGSYYEGLAVARRSDFDFLFTKKAQSYGSGTLNRDLNSPFVRWDAATSDSKWFYDEFDAATLRLDGVKSRAGPAVCAERRVNDSVVSVDLVPGWEWPYQQWQNFLVSQATIRLIYPDIASFPIHVVPKLHDGEWRWRLSFSQIEKGISKHADDPDTWRKMCLRITKDRMDTTLRRTDIPLKTYHLKTCWYHFIVTHPGRDYWRARTELEKKALLNDFINFCKERCNSEIRHFFLPDYSLTTDWTPSDRDTITMAFNAVLREFQISKDQLNV